VVHDETTCCRVFALQGEKAECGGDCGRRSGVCVACLGVTGFDMDGGSVCPSRPPENGSNGQEYGANWLGLGTCFVTLTHTVAGRRHLLPDERLGPRRSRKI
jgi:hypothetical protein